MLQICCAESVGCLPHEYTVHHVYSLKNEAVILQEFEPFIFQLIPYSRTTSNFPMG